MLNNLDIGHHIISELTRLGVTKFVISPGSRSTPLTVAAARHPRADASIHYDERGAAFYALGHAKATGIPTVLICTSGTAVTNYYPAVVEASMDNIPLIILTADRPPELIGVGANQAITQDNIYGGYPRLYLNLPPVSPDTSLENLSKQVEELAAVTLGKRPGPVHMNCQFREPLLPLDSITDHAEYSRKRIENSPSFAHKSRPYPEDATQKLASSLKEYKRGLIIVGRSVGEDNNQAILHLAESKGFPIFADIQSTLRFTKHPAIINHFDLALLKEELASQKPDVIIQFGGPYTSKRLLQYIDVPNIYYVSVKPTPEEVDPNNRVDKSFILGIAEFCEALKTTPFTSHNAWLQTWQKANTQMADILASVFEDHHHLSEPYTSFLLSNWIPNGHNLFLANSMAIREMEMFAGTGKFTGHIYANRGSSGIDGLIATAAGISQGGKRPVTLLIGDLAFLHDLNSLQLIKSCQHPVIMVVINNDGGGIFNFLPVSIETDVFETYFGTPHGLSFEHAATMFGLKYTNPTDMIAFETAYSEATQSAVSSIIEVNTERTANHQYHQKIFNRIRESN